MDTARITEIAASITDTKNNTARKTEITSSDIDLKFTLRNYFEAIS